MRKLHKRKASVSSYGRYLCWRCRQWVSYEELYYVEFRNRTQQLVGKTIVCGDCSEELDECWRLGLDLGQGIIPVS